MTLEGGEPVTPAMTLDVEDMTISTEVVGSPGTGVERQAA
jgi:hypothetical protein